MLFFSINCKYFVKINFLSVNRRIPFSVVHNPAVKFNSFHKNIFIPGVDINVQIIHNERSVTTHLLNPNL